MAFDSKLFQNPPRELGALKISHSVVANPCHDERDREAARAEYRKYKEIGYSGVVTNIPFENGYLENPANWEVLHSMLQAADDEGMRLWLYDEKGYPSGAAGGLTLKENPAWEAKGIVCLTEYGSDVKIDLPHGHLCFTAAYAYKGTGLEDIDYESAVALETGESIVYQGEPRLVAAIAVKPCFELTHAAQNVFAVRRYIDVCDKEAMQAFIRNTYQAYYDHEKEFFGGRFEAIFTDEPSYMAPYIDNGNPRDAESYDRGENGYWKIPMEDRLDHTIPLYATLHWTKAVEENFDTRYYPALFGGESETARRMRWKYHGEMSRLYGENFFGQLGRWCEEHGIAFSGHILLEDDILIHPLYEGDFFEKLRHMQVPGIDILYASPERVWNLLMTPKLVSSVAHLFNRGRVMSESSAHFERHNNIPVPVRERMCSTAMQYACGVTLINSYYGLNELPQEDNVQFGEFMQRLTLLCEGGKHLSSAALFYPIESLYADALPSETPIYNRTYPKRYKDTAHAYQTAGLELLRRQTDFDVLNTEALVSCRVENGCLVAPSGETFRAVVLPEVWVIKEEMLSRLEEAAEAGVKIIAMDTDPISDKDIGERYRNLLKKATVVSSAEEAADKAKELADAPVQADAKWMLAYGLEFEDHTMFLLVNTDGEAHEAQVDIGGEGSRWLLYPETGEAKEMKDDEKTIAFAPFETLAVWVEK